MKTWLSLGYDHESFWNQTPRTIAITFEAKTEQFEREHNERAWLAWHVAALTRTKRIPALHRLQAKRKPRRQTVRQQQNVAKAIATFYGGAVKS